MYKHVVYIVGLPFSVPSIQPVEVKILGISGCVFVHVLIFPVIGSPLVS